MRHGDRVDPGGDRRCDDIVKHGRRGRRGDHPGFQAGGGRFRVDACDRPIDRRVLKLSTGSHRRRRRGLHEPLGFGGRRRDSDGSGRAISPFFLGDQQGGREDCILTGCGRRLRLGPVGFAEDMDAIVRSRWEALGILVGVQTVERRHAFGQLIAGLLGRSRLARRGGGQHVG